MNANQIIFKIAFLVIFIIIFSVPMVAQESNEDKEEISFKGDYIEKNKVMLRWLPSSAGSWRLLNYYGYKLERAEIDTLKKATTEWKSLANNIKPLTLQEWQTKVKTIPTDTMLMVAGQAVHGMSGKRFSSLDSLEDRDAEMRNFFTAVTFAAEFSNNAAVASALGYIDQTVLENKIYIYRLTPLDSISDFKLTFNTAIVHTDQLLKLPIIVPSEIREGENAIEIFWEKEIYSEYYSSFNVYKSPDKGVTWKKYNDIPFQYSAFKDNSKFIFRDSIAENYNPQYYKLEGLTSYATFGPLSDPIIAQGKDRTPPKPPFNVTTTYLGNKEMKITWEVDPADTDIKEFRISRSNKVDKGFIELTKVPLSADTRSFIDKDCNELINNYYFIGVIDKEGNPSVSMPEHGTIIDSMPPSMPKGLQGTIDTNGVVTIHWNLGSEPDLLGYVVHFSNNDELTFYNKTDYPLRDTIWRDTIPLNVLTEKIYYKVRALDHRFNPSPFTAILTLKKPDLVPPSSPQFTSVLNALGGVELKWVNSSSHDVVKVVIQRKLKNETAYQDIYTSNGIKDEEMFIDTKVIQGKEYQYQVYAVDDVNLKSEISGSVYIKAFIDKTLPAIETVEIQSDKETFTSILSWKYPYEGKYKFAIYSSVNAGPYLTIKIIENVNTWKDKTFKKGDIVKYRIKAINDKGWQSEFSEEVLVMF